MSDELRSHRDLSRRLFAELKASRRVAARLNEPIAIVGMACRFPGGADLEAFRRFLAAGGDAVTEGRPDRLFVDPETEAARFFGAYVEGMDRFDAEFFRIAPVEAELLDPQQRLLLETSWAALEDAGLDPGGLRGSRTGVYGGFCGSDYQALVGAPGDDPSRSLYRSTGVTASAAVGRVAFALGLEGPAITVDTACSSSLVAVHQAATALRQGDMELALAGGVNAILTWEGTRIFTDAGMLAADGRCKTFDASADGYVRGEGCGMVVLKRLSDAEASGDRILGVILGSALNQDGASAGLTVPNGPAQERVIEAALGRAGIEPSSVDYLEAHGTGTELGDPVEVAAAASVYGRGRDPEHPLLLGSVKTNVGHLEGAAGIAGLIKAVLAMQAGVIPKHLHFDRPNPRIEWARLPVRVASEATPWPESDRPQRAAVSSFGYSGTNAHLIVESYAEPAPGSDGLGREVRLLPLSARSDKALRELAGRYRSWLTGDSPLADMAWTAGVGRSHFAHRAGVVFRDPGSLREQLELVEQRAGKQPAGGLGGGKVAFLYTGQGSQWAGMGRDLYESEPVAREVLERCEAVFREEREGSLLSVMFGDEEGLDRTEWTQPAVYALESALTALWGSVGICPEVVFGHSVGEIAAAQAAGVFDLEGGMRFAARRGALMGSLPGGGAMAAVFAAAERVAEALCGSVSLAADNGAHQVVSGPEEEVVRLLERFESSGVRGERLRTSHAFHSALMDPVLEELETSAGAVSAPTVPLVSDVSGRLVEGVPDGAYWRRQAREPVAFGAALRTLSELGVGLVVELGPQGVLGPMASLAWPDSGSGSEVPVLVSSLRRGGGGVEDFVAAVAAAYEAGLDVSFEGLFAGERRCRVSLPTYPFQRERYWVASSKRRRGEAGHPLLGLRRDGRDGEVSFETELSAEDPGWLSDHRVFSEVVAPGALFAAQGVEAVLAAGRGPSVALEDAQIHRPLVLSGEAGRTVQVVLGSEDRWEVVSRSAEGAPWELHAEGRVGPGAVLAGEVDVRAIKEGLAPAEVAEFYERFAAVGIALGPSFRGLTALWVGDQQAWGELALPGNRAGEGLHAHPALLDACIQVLTAIPELAGASGTFLPFGWDRLWLTGSLPERLACHARVTAVDEETWKVELLFYTATGAPVGGITGFTLKRASRSALLGMGVEDLLYEPVWREGRPVGLQAADFLRGPAAAVTGANSPEVYLEAEGLDREGLLVLWQQLERESRWHALSGLEELGWERRSGDRFDAEELRRSLKVTADHRGLFGRLLGMLDEAGVVSRDPGGGWLVVAGSGDPLPEGVGAPEGPAGSVEAELLRRSGGALADVLRGRADPLDLLFGEGTGAADRYRESGAMRASHRMVADAVGSAVSGLPEGRRLRVLEVGAGTGGATEAVLAALPPARAEYEYTDRSAGFLAAAERRFRDSGMVFRYRELDIERDPGEQGLASHRYDLVIAANALFPVRDVEGMLGHCRRLLAPSGLLVAAEGRAAPGWLELTFGLLPDWWRGGTGARPGATAYGPSGWRRALSDAGFGEVSFLGEESGPFVILARGPAEVEPEPGLYVLSGGGELAEELSRELSLRNQQVAIGPAGGGREAWRSFFGSLPGEVPFRGVAYLAGVRGDGAGLTTGELREELEAVGSDALAVVQGMSDAGSQPAEGVWFVTRGGQVVGGETSGALSGALLWGFGSALAQEHEDMTPRLLDLDPEVPPSAAVLADELLYADRETRIAWRSGERRVVRLARAGRAATPAPRGLREDRSYLVTGGLGGIGLEVAGWLAEAGAGAIVLNGRRAPDAHAEAVVRDLRERGAEVRVEIADVTDGEAVDAMLGRVEAELPPLGGVIHSVGVLSDGALANQDWARFERVLWPKVLGAWRLHRATRDRNLDLFVLFSSVAGVFGSPGQTNYAAANAFLDQLARHRRALGLPGQAIAWGPWSGIGEAEEARDRVAGRLAQYGQGWIARERGLEVLSRLVQEDAGMRVVASVDWSALPSAPPFLEDLVAVAPVGAPVPSVDLLRRLGRLPAAEREEELIAFLQEELASVLRLRSTPVPGAGFFELGMDSLMAVELRNRLNRAFQGELTLSNTAVFDYPDSVRLARHLAGALGAVLPEWKEPTPTGRTGPPAARLREEERIAIVGMACRFPGGADLEAFWRLLAAGGDAVTEGRPDRLFVDPETEAARFFGAYVEGMDRFDAEFFRIAPVEAELLDPQQRLLLETSWAALEDTGLDPGGLRGSRTGVYGGLCSTDYQALVGAPGADPSRSLYRSTGVAASAAVGRVAFALGLDGPAITVDTACSSSLVAVHQAATALRQDEADLALAGGVNAILTWETTRIFTDAGMLAADGRCKTFDASADGFVRGEGCGMVVLKRLSDAEASGDRILGVILGSALNQDGASAGLTVPNGPAQERVIEAALGRAGIEPSSVDYLEAHGTGTELGDPVEVAAAASVYGRGRDPEHPLLLGSVKTNVGHLEGAAGIAGLIKAVLAMQAGVIPKHLHFDRPNPRIEWARLPVRVASEATPWPESDRPQRAAVSSFGYSGTNAHLIVESYAEPAPGSDGLGREVRLLPLSARSDKALRELAGRYRSWLTGDSPLADMAWTAGVGRSHFAHRAGVVFRDPGSLREQLELVEQRAGKQPAGGLGGGKVAFLYTGQGSQWAGMGRDLYESEPVAREVLERCEAVFREEREGSLLSVMFGDEEGLDRTEWTQPAVYALESALTALWGSVGICPEVVFGHSVGEIAAAQAAGVFDLEGGMRFAARRGALMGSLPGGGAMAAVFAAAERVAEALCGSVSLAADNGAHQVVSGPEEEVVRLLERFESSGVRGERLRTSHAFHSALMDPVLEELETSAGAVSAPTVPLVSDVSGRLVEGVPDGAYWRRQAREPVAFGAALRTLSELGVGLVVELGPQGVLGPMASLAWPDSGSGSEVPVLVSSLRRGGGGVEDFVAAVAAAYEAGLDVSFEGLFAGERRCRVSLPTYPFQRERYWVASSKRRRGEAGHPLLGLRRDGRDGEVSFETELSAEDPGWLSDHRVFSEVVAPGALFAAQGVEAVLAAGRGPSVALEDAQIHRPLVLSGEAGRTVQVVLGSEDRWEVVSRSAEGAPWELHAEGRVGPGAVLAGEVDVRAIKEGLAPVDTAALYDRLAARGIAYGRAFRGLVGLWADSDAAVGEIEAPVDANPQGLQVPPALLDACFHVFAGIFELAADDGVWLPFGWDRLWLRAPLPERLVCHARVTASDKETSKANLAFYTAAGASLGGMTGLTVKRASRAALLGARVEDLLYELEWREGRPVGLQAADFLRGPEALRSGLRPADAYLEAEGLDREGLRALQRELEGESRWHALSGLEELGWERRSGDRFDAEELRRSLKVTADHRGLFGRLLGMLDEAGVVSRDPGGGWLVVAGSGDPLPEGVGAPEGPAGSVEAELLRRSGGALADVLRGRADPLDLLFGEGTGAADRYRESGAMRASHRMVADAVGSAVSGLPEGRRLRVLEVGAGTGGATEAVLAALPPRGTDYVYTDVSAGFFSEVESRFGDMDIRMEYRTLDIERDPGEQDFEAYGYDLVLAAHVLDATRDLAEALEHCRRLLAPSGLLVLLEGIEVRGWQDLTFGLLPGWWRFEDEYRKEHPLAGRSAWRRALADTGYGEVAILSSGESAVILARGPSEVRTRSGVWVVWPDDAGHSKELVRELREQEQQVMVAEGVQGTRRESWREFFAALPEGGRLSGVVHLGGVSGQGVEVTDRGLQRDVERLGASALAMTQGLQDAGVIPQSGIFFVTRGAQVVGGERAGELAGSILWGFARTAAQELGGLHVRMVDLDPAEAIRPAEVARELLYPDREMEVAWRGGRRLVSRLVRLARMAASERDLGSSRDRVRGDRSYLVTGGLGDLGIAAAGWLAERGAGAIVLNGRRAPEDAAAEAVQRLREQGHEVRVEIADVTDGEALGRLIAGVGPESGLPPLGGVIHSVGVLSDASLANQDWGSFERVLWPKVLGAWRLHRATMGMDLELFVLFSSFVGVLGNAGQSNYAAANAFLDQLALHRRTLGLPGQAMQWGAWSGLGEAEGARERIADRFAAAGVDWMTPEQGLLAFEHLVDAGVASAAVGVMEWSVIGRELGRSRTLLSELVSVEKEDARSVSSADLVLRLDAAPESEREELLQRFVQEEVRSVLRLPSPPSPEAGFFELGMDSLMAVELRNRVSRALGGEVPIPNTLVFDYPDIARMARYLAGRFGDSVAAGRSPARPAEVSRGDERIAIVGMAARLPGGPDLPAFWERLAEGADLVTRGRPDDLLEGSAGADPAPWGAYVPGLDRFDAEFFRIAPVEAELMDPQQRLLLETSWEALEDAGMDPEALRGSRTGVYAGMMTRDYEQLLPGLGTDQARSLYAMTGSIFAATIGRVSFALGFEGPAVAVDTACSSSLVAIHQAASGLQRGETDLALAGGVNAIVAASSTATSMAAGMLSPDGRCKTFDAAANGYVRGEGCGVLVLKRLSDAERDGDRILGVVLGSAVNQDGASAGLTTPSGPAQERVIRDALTRSGVAAASVDYLEAHGTGTELGDPIEVQAAAAVYGEGRDEGRPLLLGSVKTNIGHLEAAAGVAGVMKTLLAMRRGLIPKHLHFETPNPRMAWARLPVRVTSEATPWPEVEDRPRRAGVSSFGFSGTNAHLVLEGYGESGEEAGAPLEVPWLGESVGGPAAGRPGSPGEGRPLEGGETRRAERRYRLLPLSGRSEQALRELAGRYRGWLESGSGEGSWERLSDAAWTAGVGRSHFRERACLVFSEAAELGERLGGLAAGEDRGDVGSVAASDKVAFLFTGQGSQWAGMGRDLYEREPVVRGVLDRAEAVIREERGESLLSVMFSGEDGSGDLDATEWTQPALYALSGALVALWKSMGVAPDAVLGHSVGEVAAAHAAGVFGFEEGLRFASRRGALMGSLPGAGVEAGGMLAVFASAGAVASRLSEGNAGASSSEPGQALEVAADNGVHQVVSGRLDLLAAFAERLAGEGIRAERLVTSHAFHSSLMDPVLEDLREAAERLSPSSPPVPLVTGLTGRVAGSGELLDGAYWRRQARAPVLFAPGVGTLAELGCRVLIEIGPRAVLGPLAALSWPEEASSSWEPLVVASQERAGARGDGDFARAVARVYEAGLPVSFGGGFAGERRRRVPLPSYPFQRERYWPTGAKRRRGEAGHPLLGSRRDARGGEVSFETEFYREDPRWLEDHRVFGEVVAPGALFAAQVAEALRETGKGPAFSLEDVELHRALVLPGDEGRTVQVVLGSEDRWEVISRAADGGPWELHAEGRVRSGAVEAGGPDVRVLREGLAPVDMGAFHEELAARGITYGGAFRGLVGLRSGSGAAVGEIAAPAGGNPEGYGVPPALLDACFQVSAGVFELGADDGVWLPVGWDRLRLGSPLPERLECHARVQEDSGEIRKVDLAFYTVVGEALGGVTGFTLKRASRAALLGMRVEELLYEPVWREGRPAGLRAADFLPGPEALRSRVGRSETWLEEEGPERESFVALGRELEGESRWYALRALEDLGWERRASERFEAEALRRRLKVTGEHRRLFERLLGLLEDGGVVRRDPGGGWLVTAGSDEPPAAGLGAPEGPAGSIERELLRRCGGSLSEVLRGRSDPLELLFSGTPGAADLYREGQTGRAANRLVANTVRAAASGLPEGRRLRVLEVGAGTGGTTAAVLGGLPAERTDYDFTDISPGFFTDAERRFGESGADIRFRTLDIERDPVEQGFGGHGYDLVVAANVFYATRDLSETLRHCRRLLAPSGLLVAVEGTAPEGWLDLTFGLLPGWWRFEDGYRTDYPLVGPEVWKRVLGDTGFGEAAFLGEGWGAVEILARGPAEVEAEPGLYVLSGGGELAAELTAELSRELSGRNRKVLSGPPEGAGREEWRGFFDSLPEDVPLRGVAHLAGVRGDASGLSTEELGEEVEVVGSGALSLVQGMSDAGVRPAEGVWFVTRGGQVVGRERPGTLSGATLWGFAAVVGLEHGDLNPRLLDLDPGAPPSAAVLTDELLYPDRENRIAWREGKRLVARLVRAAKRGRFPEGGNWRFGPDPAGGLDRLRVEEIPSASLGADELRVEIEASGVNFLDVMLGMGLVDAVRTLGAELCGRVVEVGPEVSGVSVGDRVVGFASGAFGPEVVTRAVFVVPAPPELSSCELATVPVAFVTAALAFEFAELVRGDRVLIHAGTGGVGQAAIQLARAAGLEVFATASSAKQEHLRSLGVAGVFDSRDPGFGAGVMEATGGSGVDMVLNSLTGEGFIEASLSCLARRGRFVEIGKRGIWSEEAMVSARPDVQYWILALDRLLVEESQRVGSMLRGVMEQVVSGALEPLPFSRWPLSEAGAALTHMREARHVGKIVLSPSALATGRLRGDRSYLVTGGLGGIGLEVAGWLAEAGAGAIVLNGRRAPDPPAEAVVRELRERGLEVRVEIADVTDGDAVEGMLYRMEAELPPLGGVIHSVGVLSDGALTNQDWGRFEAVLRPKVLGAWRLHRATLDRDLDLFVLFSSVAGVFGNPGQANYAAANAFLDQLARHRRALGLAGQAIAWGAWSGVGEAEEARERIAGRLAAFGESWIAPEQGLRVFSRLLREDLGTSVVASVDWSALPSPPPLLEELVDDPAGMDERGRVNVTQDLSRRLKGLSDSELLKELIRFLQEELISVLRLRSAPSPETGFFELGMDSLVAVELRNRLNRAFRGALVVSNTAVFDHPDVARLARYLARELEDLPRDKEVRVSAGSVGLVLPPERERIAIVGMACRFPGGADLEAFWRFLEAGGDAVTEGRPDRLFVDPETEAARFFGAYVEGMDQFDAEFFRIAPVEAELLDPQQRLLLETSWAALEDAGLDPGGLRGSRTGVYGGFCRSDYQALVGAPGDDPSRSLYRSTGVTASTAIGRVAFALGLEGPAITVDTACSSSLVAVHQAASALRQGEADLVLAGGVNAILTWEGTRIFTDAGMLAADGRCKTFDASADGYVRGEGCGMVALKRLSDAEASGDRILGVILGSAVNQDGASAGLTVPNGPAQERVIEAALGRAGIEPSSVDYLEAHGTGTELGDPVEVAAAASVYGRGRDPEHPLLLGSVKTNVGHLEGAAGIAGLIKAVLAMQAGVIPKHLNFERPNPRIAWDLLPVGVTSEATRWPAREGPRRAAVSSFGYAGTNAHVVLEGHQDASDVGTPSGAE